MIIASIPKTTTNFILLLMPDYLISNLLTDGPESLLLQHCCLIILVILYFFEDSFIPYAFVNFVDSNNYNSAWRKERVVNFRLQSQPKHLFLQFNSRCIVQDDVIMPNHDTYPDGLGSKLMQLFLLLIRHQVTHSTDSYRSCRGNCRSIIGGRSYCSFI